MQSQLSATSHSTFFDMNLESYGKTKGRKNSRVLTITFFINWWEFIIWTRWWRWVSIQQEMFLQLPHRRFLPFPCVACGKRFEIIFYSLLLYVKHKQRNSLIQDSKQGGSLSFSRVSITFGKSSGFFQILFRIDSIFKIHFIFLAVYFIYFVYLGS